ncbi:asparagine synthase (glutamine-hydrolyzing) [Aquipuribacter sp. MA13-6]|uniref:asparagine synthase (glutamine-hydrolyzing) n=1 Tax=unclassified Aquipuribacter TaxID=2635084 RepID=UPI003EEA4872
MCGIAGVRRFGAQVDVAEVAPMVASLRHRGPDDHGAWAGDGVALGHTRLSIIDVGSSRQPMADDAGHLHMVFNGEILNYRELRRQLDHPWRTDGDTETLLAAWLRWGAGCLPMLRGQFAVAVHDSRTGELFLARDPVGILPLFYARAGTDVVFGSEPKALRAVRPDLGGLDLDAVHEYLGTRAVRAPRTLASNVLKVRPGHVLTVGADGRTSSHDYRPAPGATLDLPPARAVDLLDRTLREAVARNLVADVPVGAYLSGGLDSSLTVALVRAMRPEDRIRTFAAGFGDPRTDELPVARTVSTLLGTDHHEVHVDARSFVDDWARLSWFRDAPLSEPADVAVHALARTAREHVKVVLSGEGSDELFGGYPKYRFAGLTRDVRFLPARLRAGLLPRVGQALPESRNRMRTAARALAEPALEDRFDGWFAPFSLRERDVLTGRAPRSDRQARHGTALQQMLLHDQAGWLPDNLLERGDRMSMAASLELRPPFLDLAVVDLARRLPDDMRVRGGSGKWLVKMVAERYLPRSVVHRRKVGFKVPLDAWFRSGLSETVRDLLLDGSSFVARTLDRDVVRAVVASHETGRRNEEARLWTLMSLEMWARHARDRE